jgi:hypothetical protein
MATKAENYNRSVEGRDDSKYAKQKDGSYKCGVCGVDIFGKKVAHPIWDGPFAMSGSGKCHYETAPYCPNCDEEPNSSGEPIAPKGSYHNP